MRKLNKKPFQLHNPSKLNPKSQRKTKNLRNQSQTKNLRNQRKTKNQRRQKRSKNQRHQKRSKSQRSQKKRQNLRSRRKLSQNPKNQQRKINNQKSHLNKLIQWFSNLKLSLRQRNHGYHQVRLRAHTAKILRKRDLGNHMHH